MKFMSAIFILALGTLQAVAHADTASREAALDARLGIDRTFPRINLAALRTRDQLRESARIRTGLPSYDQQVEGASSAPAALLAELRAPAAPAPRRAATRTTQTSPAPTQETQPQQQQPEQQQQQQQQQQE